MKINRKYSDPWDGEPGDLFISESGGILRLTRTSYVVLTPEQVHNQSLIELTGSGKVMYFRIIGEELVTYDHI